MQSANQFTSTPFSSQPDYARADTEMKRKAIEKASSGICEIDAGESDPDAFDDDTLKRLYGLR